ETWWNATIAAASRPASGDVRTNATGSGAFASTTFPGFTSYGQCAHGGTLTDVLRANLAAATLASSPPTAPVSSKVTFSADVGGIVGGTTNLFVQSASVTVYEPLPSRNNSADTWIRAGSPVALAPAGSMWTGTWTVPAETLYGAHPALLRIVILTEAGTTFELRRATIVHVALPTGEVPIDPIYRVSLQAWLPDWA
ncbi:MAG TPA: hypothetical protein VM582_08345, partial [Candidatus Thermoplasmatota archaeon]|nr:hypothetical protein [Candidatus Thermoplasmatota archaeon]